MNAKTFIFSTQNQARFQIKATAALLLVACIIPLLIHLIPPYQGMPMGAILLPMFYIPFIAIVFFRLHVGLIVAALSPVVNFLLTGNPQWQIATVLSFELVIFALIASRLLQIKGIAWVAAPLSYLVTKIISSTALFLLPVLLPTEPMAFFLTSVGTAVPGILMLWLINLAVRTPVSATR